jgi:hypothetical protein
MTNLLVGGGFYDVDRRRRNVQVFTIGEQASDATTYAATTDRTVYSYFNLRFPLNLTWTLGLSYDDFDTQDLHISKLNPKPGMAWAISDRVGLRLAGFRTIKPPLLANRTIQPTQISGFNQFFDDANGTETWGYGVGVDVHLFPRLYGGLEVSRRVLSEPVGVDVQPSGAPGKFVREDRHEEFYRGYLYWTPDILWAVTGEIFFDRYKRDLGQESALPKEVQTLGMFF